MKKYIVNQGEDIIDIAISHNISDWKSIYHHKANARLKEMRPDPMRLTPGDVVYIPETSPIVFSCSTNQKHKFTLEIPKKKVLIKLMYEDQSPIANAKIECSGLTDKMLETESDSSGIVLLEPTIFNKKAQLKIWPNPDCVENFISYECHLAHLDDPSSITGLQGSLSNLSYYDGQIDGDYGPLTHQALIDSKDAGLNQES